LVLILSKSVPSCREKGVGSTFTPVTASREQAYIDNNRIEVLRLILVLLSKQIYQSPSSILATPTRYTQYFVQKVSRKLVLTTLCSLLNVVVNSPSTQTQSGISAGITGVGKGITKGLNQLPYAQGWNGDDAREGLISTAMQVLITLLDYQSSNARDIPSSGPSTHSQPVSEPASAQHASTMLSSSASQPGLMSPLPSQGVEARAPSPKTNHFRYFLSKIHRAADLKYLLDGLLAVLGGC
jgi:High-temperature-induced dauer-formation protein